MNELFSPLGGEPVSGVSTCVGFDGALGEQQAPARSEHPACLRQSTRLVGPVVHRTERPNDACASVGQRKDFGGALDERRSVHAPERGDPVPETQPILVVANLAAALVARHGSDTVIDVITALSMTVGRARAARVIAELAHIGSADRVIDVGCGPGTAVREACCRGASATSVDPSATRGRGAARRSGWAPLLRSTITPSPARMQLRGATMAAVPRELRQRLSFWHRPTHEGRALVSRTIRGVEERMPYPVR